MNKKRLLILLFLIILSIILLIIITNLINVNNNLNKENSNNNIENNNNINSNNNNINNNILDINSKLVKQLYNYILTFNTASEETVYQRKKVTVNDISNDLKILTAFNILDFSSDNDITINNNPEKLYFKKETIDKRVKQIFGDNVIVTPPLNPIISINYITYKDNYYIVTPGKNGIDYWLTFNKLLKAERKNDEIYLYDNFCHLNLNDNSETYYNTCDKEKILFTNKSEIQFNELDKSFMNENIFKHTFKLNNHKKYNWISTEKVN